MSYVYLMRSGERYKIGLAKNVERRWRQLRTADPAISIVHVIRSPQADSLEMELHRRFHHQHIALEWFRLSTNDVRFIQSLGRNAGKWIEGRRARRRLWKQVRWLGAQIVRIAILILILLLIWQVAIRLVPLPRGVVLRIR